MLTGTHRRLRLPTETAALDERALELATTILQDRSVRAELAAICLLRARGSLEFEDLRRVIEAPYLAQLAEPIWQTLQLLAEGIRVPFEAPPEVAESAHYEAWWRHQSNRAEGYVEAVFADFKQLLDQGLLFASPLLHRFPSWLMQLIEYEIAKKLFHGPFSYGIALEAQPLPLADGLSGEDPFACLWIVEALALATHDSIRDLEEAKGSCDEEAETSAGRRLLLWWLMLCGFVYSSLRQPDSKLTYLLALHPRVTTCVCDAITEGRSASRHHNVPFDTWRRSPSYLQTVKLKDLVARLEAAVESRRQRL